MSMVDNPMVGALSRYLDLAAFRAGVVAGNMANVDTPGYRTRDVDFARELHRALDGDSMTKPEAREISGLIERPDGNNVSVDRESLLLAQTQLQFHTGVELLRSEFRRLSTAINEGK